MISLTDAQTELLGSAFRPHAPIEDANSFVGRRDQLSQVRSALKSDGLHIIVFGERGCGKTSLANVATSAHARLQVFCEETATFASLLRDAALKYQAMHPTTITFDAVKDAITSKGVTLSASALTGNMFLQLLEPRIPLCIIFDELDRIQHPQLIPALAELAKNAATYHPKLTLVMVGADETADGLLNGHLSNFRNIRQVPLSRMEDAELRAILINGEKVLNIKFDPQVSVDMITMSDQMPYYLHLLATNSAQVALEQGSVTVTRPDLAEATIRAAKDVEHTLRETYEFAALSQKGSSIYRRLIWAMASMDGAGCNVGTINERANAIARGEGDDDVSPQALGAGLKRLISSEKREIVAQVMPGVYKFSHPLMKGFVRVVRFGK